MCEVQSEINNSGSVKTIPVTQAIGMVLAHDITEIRKDEFKGRAFRKGHIIRDEDVGHLLRLGKENLYVLELGPDEMHENDAAYSIANALAGDGIKLGGEPVEGKINLIAERDGILKVNKEVLLRFNMLGDVMCATMHNNSLVKKGQVVAGTRAIPLVVKRGVVEQAVEIAKSVQRMQDTGYQIHDKNNHASGVIEVKEIRSPRTGVVITGNEVYHGRIKDTFAPVIKKKIEAFGGEVVGIYYAPDDVTFIETKLRELIAVGSDFLITTGGMSVDPDDVTRFAIKKLGATDITYGSSVLPGAMFLVAYLVVEKIQDEGYTIQDKDILHHASGIVNHDISEPRTPNSGIIPILGIPACGMYNKVTIFDLVLPRILAGEKIGRKELAELGHGGLCLTCEECRYPLCPFGRGS